MQNRLLVICGPTSTGKTTLALRLAKKTGGELVSADSRQVYKGMDIGTGKDLPSGAKLKTPWFKNFGYYEIAGIRVWGYDLATPRHPFSVASYLKFAERIIADIRKRGKLPIVVGGTGLYIKAVVDGIPTVVIPRNDKLRKNLERKPVGDLFEMLAQLDAIRAGGMNASDKKNPRRLIRAIEIATSKKKPIVGHRLPANTLFIGLTAPAEVLFSRIKKRVETRMKEGVEEEIKRILGRGVGWGSQAMTSLGYKEWKDYLGGKKTRKELVKKWTEEERNYAKRQLVWFKKDKRINWFDVAEPGFVLKVEKMVGKWYIRP